MSEKYSLSFISFDAHKPPSFKEFKNKEYIVFGSDRGDYFNNYPQYLIDNKEKSPIHSAICNKKAIFIVGNGMEVVNFSDAKSLAIATAMLKSVNKYEDADDITRKISTDAVVFGGWYCELIPNKGNELGEIYHLPFQNLRKGKDEEEQVWYYTEDWTSRKPEDNKDWKVFHEFDGSFDPSKNYLIQYSFYRVGNSPYALPDYMSANPSIETDWRISNFLLNNVKSGFSAGYIVNFFNGDPTPEQKADIEKKLKEKFAGDDNGGSFILNFAENGTQSAEVIAIPTNGSDDRFNLLEKQVNNKLMQGHEINNQALFGVMTTSGLSNNKDEVTSAFQMFQNTYVNDKQRLIEKFWNDILAIKGANAQYRIIETTPFGQVESVNEVALALGNLSPLVATKILDAMTSSEVRALIGLEGGEIKQEQQFADKTDEIITKHFFDCGILDDDFEVIQEMEVKAGSIEEVELMSFAVSNIEQQILEVLKANPNITINELSEAVGLPENDVQDVVDELAKKKLISVNDSGELKSTSDGKDQADEREIFTVYKYELRPDAPKLEGKSRLFCQLMIGLSAVKSWTIDDIKKLKNGSGLDVFTSRGGWYTNPNTGVHTPFCRHRWVAKLVRKK